MKKISKIIIILITTFILTISLIVGNNVSMAKEETYNIKQAKDKLDKINSLIEEAKEYNKKGYKIDTTKLIEAQTICNQLYSNALLYEPAILYNNDVDTVEEALKKYEEDKVKLNIPNITTTNKDISGTSTVTSGTGSTSGTSTTTSGTGSTPETSSGLETSTSSSESSDFGDTYYIPKSISKVDNGIFVVDASTKNKNYNPGDGSGIEVLIQVKDYDNRIYKVYRSNDMKFQKTMAFLAADLSNNDNIGYIYAADTLRTYFRKHNYNPDEITELCDTDCSAFVSIAIEGAYAKSGQSTKVERMATSGMPDSLKKYGFNVVNEMGAKTIRDFYKTGQLQIGDILVTVGEGHTAIFLGPYYTTGKIAPSVSGSYGSGVSGGYTADGEEIDDRQNIDEKRFRFSGLPGDVTYEGEINPIRNFFKKIGDFIDYLLGLLFLIIKVLIIGFTNIIYNIFLTITSFMKK